MPIDFSDTLKKISPNAYRNVLLSTNVLLTLCVLWCGLKAFDFDEVFRAAGMTPPGKRIKGFEPVTDLEIYHVREKAKPARQGARAAIIANLFEPPPPPVIVAKQEPAPEPKNDTIQEGGPLAEKWEITSGMLMPGEAQRYVVIAEKRPQQGIRTSRYSRYRQTRSTRSSRSVRRVYRRSRQCRLLRVYDENINPDPTMIGDDSYYLLAVREDPFRIIYTSDAVENLYVLEKERKQRNPLLIRPEEDEGRRFGISTPRQTPAKKARGRTAHTHIRAKTH